MIEQNTAFIITTKNCKSGYLSHRSRKSIFRALIQVPNVQLELPVSINVFEMQTILLRFQLHKNK